MIEIDEKIEAATSAIMNMRNESDLTYEQILWAVSNVLDEEANALPIGDDARRQELLTLSSRLSSSLNGLRLVG